MKVLIACEESQTVCKAFRKLGHEAYSCDILPCSGGHPEWHIQGNVLKELDKDWDLIIAHPPCTHIAVSGARYFEQKRKDGRQQEAIDFFMKFTNIKCPMVAIENPICIMSSKYCKPDQIIQPYMFGDATRKTTCLWLKGLPKLTPTNVVEPKIIKLKNGENDTEWHFNSWKLPPEERSRMRSKTFQGIADAMADQWSNL
jgi:site-specific DNA-cytosine methylase